MKAFAVIASVLLFSAPCLFAGAHDTTVFHTRMLPENEVPALSLPGTSGTATITIRVVRDGRGAVSAATVVFDIDYTMPQPTTFVGLHIHNAVEGVNGPVEISSGLSGTNSVTGTSGHLTRVVNIASTDAKSLGFVSGILNSPELYYVNMHSTVYPGGFMRGQLLANTVSFRPALSPADEVPAVTDVDGQAAALITVNVNRDDSGKITSGAVTFEVNYRFAGGATIVGMHIHSGAAGANGPVVISAGIANPITNSGGRGTLFRRAEIPGTDTVGLAALQGLMTDPSGYYINIHTPAHPAGVMRGQLQKDVLNFYSQLTGSQEVPANTSTGFADVLTTARVIRDAAGNISSGSVTFAVNYAFGGPVTLVGLHIHNADEAVNGPVEISSGLGGGANSIASDSGKGSFTRDATVDSGNSVGLATLNGLFTDPREYYVNLHTTVDPGGEIRAQLERETYHFDPVMASSNETAHVSLTASGASWLTVVVDRDAKGAISGGTVTFDVDCSLGGPATVVAMHIHKGTAGSDGPVVIGSGISAFASPSGTGNITAEARVASSDTTALNALAGLIENPAGYYLNLHTDAYPAGLMRSQLLPYVSFDPQVAGGGQWMSSITITNPSDTSAVNGLVEIFDRNGDPMRPAIIDSTIPFLIPPSASVSFSTYNGGDLTDGYARIHSSAPVNSSVGYVFDGLPSVPAFSSAVATSASIPVSIGNGGAQNTGIAILDLSSSPPVVVLTLQDSTGAPVPGGSATVSFSSGKRIVGLLNQLLPGINVGESFKGTLTVQSSYGPFPGGVMSMVALQFDSGNVVSVPITVIR
jgi:hypothetical protein